MVMHCITYFCEKIDVTYWAFISQNIFVRTVNKKPMA